MNRFEMVGEKIFYFIGAGGEVAEQESAEGGRWPTYRYCFSIVLHYRGINVRTMFVSLRKLRLHNPMMEPRTPEHRLTGTQWEPPGPLEPYF